MSFLSYPFLWAFLPVSLLVYWVAPRRARAAVLLVLNLAFYLYGPRWQLLPLLGSIVLTYCGARAIAARSGSAAARRLLAVTLTANFGLLLAFKLAAPALPLGLSFYIFAGSGYVIDVYRQDLPAQKNFLQHAAFISFFPTVSAGPILRSGPWYAQLEENRRLTWDRLKKAFLLFLWGVFLKMVIADRIALYVDAIYVEPHQFHGWFLVLAVILYPLQLYADFAGYSMMALGVACAFGFDLPDNFRQPYLETSFVGFWRCWHISLTSWFKDYLYMPLAMADTEKLTHGRLTHLPAWLCEMLVFLCSGFWHGAASGFIVWGALNGLYNIAENSTKKFRKRACKTLSIDRSSPDWKIVSWLFVYSMISFSLIFFRAGSVYLALTICYRALRLDNPWILFDGTLETFGIGGTSGTVLMFALLVLLLVSAAQKRGVNYAWFAKRWGIFRGLVLLALLGAILVFGIYGPGYNAADFIYAGF